MYIRFFLINKINTSLRIRSDLKLRKPNSYPFIHLEPTRMRQVWVLFGPIAIPEVLHMLYHAYVQDHLGEVVFVELPEAGKPVSQGSSFGAVESVKATSDINSPISGEVVEVNTKLTESPGLVIKYIIIFTQILFFMKN